MTIGAATSSATGNAAGAASITITSGADSGAGSTAGASSSAGSTAGAGSTATSVAGGSSGNAGGGTASREPAKTIDSMTLLYRKFAERRGTRPTFRVVDAHFEVGL